MKTNSDELELEERLLQQGPAPLWPHRNRAERETIRGEVVREMAGKTAITIRLDDDVLEAFRMQAGDRGYQTLINRALREWLTAQSVKELVREELCAAIGATH